MHNNHHYHKFTFKDGQGQISRLIVKPYFQKQDSPDVFRRMLDEGWTYGADKYLNEQIERHGLSFAHGESGLSGFLIFKNQEM